MELPLIHSLQQSFDQPKVADVERAIAEQIGGSRLKQRVQRGGQVAVAVGSRGIANLQAMVRATVRTLKEMELSPFVVAAMGSHGGATPAGQRQLLASYGITESAIGAPIRTDMDVVELGVNSWGEPVFWDRNAYHADAVVTLSRVKPHTDFHSRFESGIVKMLVIGLGKQRGAAVHHQYGVRGLRDMIPETAKVVLSKSRFALGLAIVENANEQTGLIRAVEPEELFDVEPQLLEQARSWMPQIPFDRLDLLVVGELGKNYSGTGMDVNVIGRWMVEGDPEPERPRITRICVLDLSAESHGNAVGLGLADLTTQRLIDQRDERVTNMNYFTSCFMLRAKTPIALPDDRPCIEAGLRTCWQPKLDRLRAVLIPNTLELTQLWISPALVDECRHRPGLTVDGTARPIPFANGRLCQEELFPDSTRARRVKK